MGDKGKSYRVSVETPQGKRSLGRPRLRWEDNIRMHVKEIGMEAVAWIRISCKHCHKYSGCVKCWKFLEMISNY
jgi:hypothetical protein